MKKVLTLFTALIWLGSMSFAQAVTYTPAGTPESVFTAEWAPNTPANDMTLSNGLYVFAKKSDFAQTSISFKVCQDHAWTTAYPGSNYNYTIPAGAKYLIITYNTSGNAVNAFAISSMTVAGDNGALFGSTWSPSTTANDMTLQGDGTYKFEKEHVALSAGTINFKACANHSWDNAWPGSNYSLSIPESGEYTITITFDPKTLVVSATADLEVPVVVIPTIQIHSNITNPSWESSANFTLAGNEETASLTLSGVTKGNYEFGVEIGGSWTSNGSAFTRANNSHAVTTGSGNCTFNADRNGDYTFTWTFASNTLEITYPVIPAQSVTLSGIAPQILKGTTVNFADYVSSSGIDEPGYRFYVKPQGGDYSAVASPYTFAAAGEYTIKVEALEYNTGDPVASDEAEVQVYDTYTFTNGTILYVDFSAMTEGAKGVNYPYGDNKTSLDHDGAGAGTLKTIVFTADVEWTTNDVFIKTEKNGWAAQKFTVPGAGQNKVVVAADGASYTWETFAPSTYYFKNKWDNDEWTWEEATADGTGKFRLENVIFGGNGVNYNFIANDAGAVWKDYTKIKYMDNAEAKVVSVYDTINLVLDPANDSVWAEMVKKEKVAFTVAGNRLSLFDLGWEPTHPYKYTDMKKQTDGTYLWNNGGEEAVIPSGQLELKVIKNRDYANGNWPKAGNFEYNVQRSAEYEIAIHFNPYTETIWIDTVLTKLMNIQELSIKGSWDSWAAATPFVLGGDYDKSLATLSLAAGDYEFKLVDGNNKWYGDGEAFVRNDNSHRGVVAHDAGANMTIHVDKAGEYLFSYYFDGEQLKVSYPGIVPAEKIAPLSGKFTINAKGDTAVFSRGNLQYNYESDEWYAAEKQYEVLGDLNLHFGDNTYQGSVDLFGWSCASSDYGKQWKYKDGDFTGDFVDWGGLFAGDEKEWGTLSLAEWNYLLGRTKGGKKLWTMINIGPDSINGLALLPDDWSAPACASDMVYGFYNLDDEVNYKKNAFTMAEWAEMEASGVAFLPLGGARAGYYGNTWSGSAESTLSNPLASGYDWVDNENWMGYYWLSSTASATQVSTVILPGWHNNEWTAPAVWAREKRRGQSVRLVTRIPKVDFEDVRTGLNAGHYYTVCYDRTMKEIRGASLWSFIGKDASFAYIQEESAPFAAGKPYIVYAESEKLEAILEGDAVDAGALVENHGLHGTFSLMEQADLNAAGSDIYLVIGDELRRATGNGQTGNRLPAYRAYVKLDEIPDDAEPVPAPGRRVRSMPMQGQVATGIENGELINGENGVQKVLINGQLFLIRGEKMYDATGRLVKE